MTPAEPIPVNKDRLYADVEFLTSLTPPRNAFNLVSLNKSAAYIYQEFRENIPAGKLPNLSGRATGI